MVYLDSLRAVAIIGVLLLHVVAAGWYTQTVESSHWQWLNAIDSLVRFCVPVFFMVSGAIFLDPNRSVHIRTILRKNIPRIAIPFSIWSLFFTIVVAVESGGKTTLLSNLTNFVLGYYHLWFLIALAGLYLATPLLRAIVVKREIAWYCVILAGIFASFLPLVTHAPVIGPVLNAFLGKMQFEIVLGYSMYFVLGYLLHTSRFTARTMRIMTVAGIAGVIITALGTTAISLHNGEPSALLYGYLTPNVAVAAVTVFLLIKHFYRESSGRQPSKILEVIGKNSFGIYLIHPFFQLVWQKFGLTVESGPPIFSAPILFFAILLPSLGAAILLSRIPKVGRFIV